MVRRGLLALGALALLIGVLAWWVQRPSPRAVETPVVRMAVPSPAPTLSVSPAPLEVRRLEPTAKGVFLLPEAATLAHTLNDPTTTPEQDLETLSTLVGLFRRAHEGAIPAGGLHEEIVEALCGKNAAHFAVLPADCPGLTAAGELRDRWGTPYFLHPLSREVLQIRSAGPDRKFGTADDLDADPNAGVEIPR